MQAQGQSRGQQGRPDVEARPKTGEDLIKSLMAERKREVMALFAKDENPEASYVRAVGFAVNAYRKVQADSRDKIDEYSVVAAALWAIQRKLDPGAEVYFVPYKGKVTPITSPQGLINLAHRSAFVLSVNAGVVFREEVERGFFDHQLGSERWVKHKKGACVRPPNPKKAWEELAFAWCVVDLKGGQQIVEVLDKGDIEYYRSLSAAADRAGGLWEKFGPEAARKACMKQALGRAPKSSEVSEILAAEDAEHGIEIPDDIWTAIQKRGAPPAETASNGSNGHAPPAARHESNGGGERHSGGSIDARPGDPSQIQMPGKKGETKSISQASYQDLQKWEDRLRKDLDSGAWDTEEKARFKAGNVTQLATIRAEMRSRGIAHPDHPLLGKGYSDSTAAPATSAREDDGTLSPEDEERIFATAGADDFEEAR